MANRKLGWIHALTLGALLVFGCAQDEARLGVDPTESQGGGFESPPAAVGDAGADAPPVNVLMCTATACPAPYATCASDDGPSYKCGTDLAHDRDNCGACGNKCLVYAPIDMTSRCVDGTCELECMNDPFFATDRRNCNGEVDDGCEVDVLTDVNNCGACGKQCAAGEPCLKGKCGCAPPKIACNGECVNPKLDDFNCGGCGILCDNVPSSGDACAPMPANTYYGCAGGTCGNLKCGGAAADCNKDMGGADTCASDGCEVGDIRTDRNNCGGCGIVCAANEECVDEGNGPECAVPCAKFGKVLCPSFGQCFDLLSDTNHCGGCGNVCPAAGANQVRSCNKGRCDVACAAGWADCNGVAADGCETNLLANPGHCGQCGNRCDIGAGQPCVEGKCLMQPCDGEVTK